MSSTQHFEKGNPTPTSATYTAASPNGGTPSKTTHWSGTTHQNGQTYHSTQTLTTEDGMTTLKQTNRPTGQ